MKARLYKIGETYYIQSQSGELQRVTRSAARNFLLNFSDNEYSKLLDKASTPIEDYDGEVIVELVENNYLLVKNAELFRILIENTGITLVSVKQFAEMHGKSASMTRRHCQNGRIDGAVLTPGGYIIPEDAAYPK